MTWVLRFMAQMEQLQSHATRRAGAEQLNRTALQWQPPVCSTRGGSLEAMQDAGGC